MTTRPWQHRHRVPVRPLFTRAATPRRFTAPGPLRALVNGPLLRISPEVTEALATHRRVVALETTIYTHGALGNDLDLESLVRQHGAVPAVCGVLAGQPTVGLVPDEVQRMVHEGARKLSRRDLAFAAVSRMHGGTTISATMLLARLAGIRVLGTGGLGGVHRGVASTLDISADLTELGRTRLAVVCSGCKGFLDTGRTLEYLETQGCAVATFADGRNPDGMVEFPAFWVRESGCPSPMVVRDEEHAARMVVAQERLGIESGLLLANPVPVEAAIPREEMEKAIEQAVRQAEELGITGPGNTPFVLKRIRALTNEGSVRGNQALVRANVVRAARVAVEVARLLNEGDAPQ